MERLDRLAQFINTELEKLTQQIESINADYRQAREALEAEFAGRRQPLETELATLKRALMALQGEAVPTVPAPVASSAVGGMASGLTASIREILRNSEKPLGAVAIRDGLVERGFHPERYKNFLTTVHNTVKRLAENGELIPKDVDGRKLYSMKK